MTRTWFVGNIPFSATKEELEALIESRGVRVEDTRLMRDKHTRDFLGWGFVEVASDLDPADESGPFFGLELRGRTLRIALAKGERNSGFRGPDPARRERARAARQRAFQGA